MRLRIVVVFWFLRSWESIFARSIWESSASLPTISSAAASVGAGG
jgi:hypothetical protein